MKQQIRYFAAIGIVALVLIASSPNLTITTRVESEDESLSDIEPNTELKALRDSQRQASSEKMAEETK